MLKPGDRIEVSSAADLQRFMGGLGLMLDKTTTTLFAKAAKAANGVGSPFGGEPPIRLILRIGGMGVWDRLQQAPKSYLPFSIAWVSLRRIRGKGQQFSFSIALGKETMSPGKNLLDVQTLLNHAVDTLSRIRS
jgi:hypothetical protein